jgi:hypothetical protein
MKIKRILIIVLYILILPKAAFVQGCGPFCPVCSGTGGSTSALVSKGVIISNILVIPQGEEETGVINLRGGVTSWLDLGVGYTIEADKFLWSIRLQPVCESESSILRPSVIIGTGSVQTGGSDQSLFLQVSKSWEISDIFSVRLSTGIASLLPELEKYYGLAGIIMTITENWSPFVSYDGISVHPGISWIPKDWLSVGAVLIESKEPALSVGLRFGL